MKQLHDLRLTGTFESPNSLTSCEKCLSRPAFTHFPKTQTSVQTFTHPCLQKSSLKKCTDRNPQRHAPQPQQRDLRIFLASLLFAALVPSALAPAAHAQQTIAVALPPPIIHVSSPSPASLRPSASTTTHPTAAAAAFHDPTYKASFDYPSNWVFSRSDGEITTFHLDARSAPHTTSMRAVAAIPENPYPESTFEGAYIYFSVTPHATASSCARQAGPPAGDSASAPEPATKSTVSKPSPEASASSEHAIQIDGIPFSHGHDQQKAICVVERDDIYTTYRRGSCYRFDLAINNFCGGEVSGVRDITSSQLDDVRGRLESIMSTFRFDAK